MVYETIQEEPSQTNFSGMTKDHKLDMIIAILVKLEERLKVVEKVLGIEYRKTDEQRESDKPEQETQEKKSQDKESKSAPNFNLLSPEGPSQKNKEKEGGIDDDKVVRNKEENPEIIPPYRRPRSSRKPKKKAVRISNSELYSINYNLF
ncbi:unnamed protein product [Arabis nemorensis]|uniref:Uncharacterized protein n=1 Tax=Arabis nemorensis TaxID=586526 RepID=A0A565CKH2_9BRAS|nr:unnamed protein product [Arabis nemorensis]